MSEEKLSYEDLEKIAVLAVDSLVNYANPESYFAITIWPDRPAGWFADDFSYDEEFQRDMPGKEARETITAIEKIIEKNN